MTDEVRREVEFVEVTRTRASKVLWSLTWRIGGFSTLAGFLAGIISAIVSALARVDPETGLRLTLLASGIVVLLGGPVVGPVVMRMVVKKRFSDFRIVLIKQPEVPSQDNLCHRGTLDDAGESEYGRETRPKPSRHLRGTAPGDDV